MYGTRSTARTVLEKGLKWFSYKGVIGLKNEMGQLDDRDCLDPRHVKELSNREQKRAQWALAYLTKKCDGTINSRTVFNDKATREWMSKEDSISPMASTESLILLAIIDMYEKRNLW